MNLAEKSDSSLFPHLFLLRKDAQVLIFCRGVRSGCHPWQCHQLGLKQLNLGWICQAEFCILSQMFFGMGLERCDREGAFGPGILVFLQSFGLMGLL